MAPSKRFRPGEYVYLPEASGIYKWDKESNIKDFKRLDHPHHLMFVCNDEQLSVHGEWYKVFYEGSLWSVADGSIYKIKEK